MNIKSIMIGAVMLAVGMLSAAPAFAASNDYNFNVAITNLVTRKLLQSGGMFGGPPPSTHFQQGDMIGIACDYGFSGYTTEHQHPWTIGIYVDGHKISSQNGKWPYAGPTGGAGYIGLGYSAFQKWRATTGHHTVRCVLNENGAITETTKEDDQRSIGIDVVANATNLPKLRLGGPSKRMSPNGNMTMNHGLAPMPNAHVRKCPTSVKAVSKIDPQAFFAPFATASKPTKIPDGHLDLYLNSVETFNDTLLCSYATRAGNAKTTVEIACKGAQKTVNGAYCQ